MAALWMAGWLALMLIVAVAGREATRELNVFQITANVPGKGTIEVLASPSLEQGAEVLSHDKYGNGSFSFGGAFLVPYPNRIIGTLSKDGKTVTTEWHGKTITLPANWKGKKPGARPHAMHGLILDAKTDDVKVEDVKDGQHAHDKAKQLTAPVSHENPSRIGVVAQETQHAS